MLELSLPVYGFQSSSLDAFLLMYVFANYMEQVPILVEKFSKKVRLVLFTIFLYPRTVHQCKWQPLSLYKIKIQPLTEFSSSSGVNRYPFIVET